MTSERGKDIAKQNEFDPDIVIGFNRGCNFCMRGQSTERKRLSREIFCRNHITLRITFFSIFYPARLTISFYMAAIKLMVITKMEYKLAEKSTSLSSRRTFNAKIIAVHWFCELFGCEREYNLVSARLQGFFLLASKLIQNHQ